LLATINREYRSANDEGPAIGSHIKPAVIGGFFLFLQSMAHCSPIKIEKGKSTNTKLIERFKKLGVYTI
jgi:hypothetical protein